MFVWLASYPKSGNTWIRMMLNSLHLGGGAVDINALALETPQAAARGLFDLALGLQSSDLTPLEIDAARTDALRARAANATEPIFAKIHDAWRVTASGEPLFPKDITRTSLYIARDPRDVAISFAHHGGNSVDETILRMGEPDFTLARGKNQLGGQLPQVMFSWSAHVESWLDLSGHTPLLLRYEDMLADPVDALRKVRDHIGWPHDDATIAAAVEQTRFDRLAAQEKEKGGFKERLASDRVFFRQGKAGGWRDVLTAEQARRIEDDHGAVMKRLGYL